MHPNNTVADPTTSTKYPVPDSIFKSVQITNPTNKSHKKCYTVGTTDETSLHQKLLKECMNTYQLNKLYQQMQIPQNPQAKSTEQPKNQNVKKKETEILQCLQQLFRRKYIRGKRNIFARRKNTAPHQAAATAAAAAQAQPPNFNNTPEKKISFKCSFTQGYFN